MGIIVSDGIDETKPSDSTLQRKMILNSQFDYLKNVRISVLL